MPWSSENGTDFVDKSWFRYLVVAALLSGAGGGITSLATEAALTRPEINAALRARDQQITGLQKRVERLEAGQGRTAIDTARLDQIIESQAELIREVRLHLRSHVDAKH